MASDDPTAHTLATDVYRTSTVDSARRRDSATVTARRSDPGDTVRSGGPGLQRLWHPWPVQWPGSFQQPKAARPLCSTSFTESVKQGGHRDAGSHVC
eukprot:48797-Hanusia_phi.AAC.1